MTAMDWSSYDEPCHTICMGDGSSPSVQTLARFNLHPKVYSALYGSGEDHGLDRREHILARITPRELLFIELVCLNPERTDEEIRAAVGLQERTVLAYYTHLGRNFKVRNSEQLRHWAFKNRLFRTADEAPAEEPPDLGFDPWVRWR